MSASLSSAVSPRCRHFGSCGGCQLQNLAYDDQLSLKVEKVRRLTGLEIAAAHAAPQAWNYRNKMEFSFGDVYPPIPGGPTVKLGLKPRGKWFEILDLQECFLPSPETPALLAAVRRWAEENKVPPYNIRRHTGVLRHLVLREAKNTGERLVLLVTAPAEIPVDSFVKAVLEVYPATTIVRGVNGKISDTAVSDQMGALYGPGHVTEELRFPGQSVRYRISPQAFFQTNTLGTEVLYGLLRRWFTDLGATSALDLYCGGGGIALSLAGVVKKVYGVELNAAAVEDAKANAALNGIENAQFFAGEVQALLPSMLALGCEAGVIDPPRAGLHPTVVPPLLQSGPRHLLYVSCNPEALARDLKALEPAYKVKRAEVVDLFPHTEHVETVVELRR